MEEDDDLNAYILSEEKELIKKHLSRIEEINEKMKEICKKASTDRGEHCFDEQKTESNKSHNRINKRLLVLSVTFSTNKNLSSYSGRHNHSKEQSLLMLPKLECIKVIGVKPLKFEF